MRFEVFFASAKHTQGMGFKGKLGRGCKSFFEQVFGFFAISGKNRKKLTGRNLQTTEKFYGL